ncbi:MAG: hypothetical protein LBE07_03495 [Gordonia sp. (in: high G+C Gram-positive bacteria)]|nr:hypothetical protein [Gordonia sp. (in: high G+C Gram-positive bacteria)]
MCRPSRCRTCGKTTWAGCGSHIAQVKASVPAGQWCAGTHAAKEETTVQAAGGGLFRRFRR